MLSVVKPSKEIPLISIFHPKEKKNRKLYSRFSGLIISDAAIEKALCVYGSGLFYLNDVFYDPRRIYNFSIKRYEGKLVLTGRARFTNQACVALLAYALFLMELLKHIVISVVGE